MNRVTVIFLAGLLLTGCAQGQIKAVGERVQELEEVACPFTTVRNVERAAVRMMRVIIPDWERVCE